MGPNEALDWEEARKAEAGILPFCIPRVFSHSGSSGMGIPEEKKKPVLNIYQGTWTLKGQS